jgi:hypothetical protein
MMGVPNGVANRYDSDGPGASGLSRRNQTGVASPGPGNNYSGSSPPTPSGHSSRSAGSIGSSKVDSATGYSSSQYYQQSAASNFGRNANQSVYDEVEEEDDFEQSLTAEERQMLEMENENIVQKLETELNQVRYENSKTTGKSLFFSLFY